MSQVYLFPGQGSQFKGMGKGLFSSYPELIAQADQLLGYSIEELCSSDPDGVLSQTQYTQPALYTVNALTYLQYSETRPAPAVLAGHSLGEFNALMAAGAFDFLSGLAIVKQRGELMSKASGGAMAAVLGLALDDVLALLEDNDLTAIDVANINSGTQIILSGLAEDLRACDAVFEQKGARYIPLNVSAAFHSRYMKAVQTEFSEFLQSVELAPLKLKVVSNWTADFYPDSDYIDHIANQLVSPVKWYQSISRLVASGHSQFEELGPGLVLSRLASEIIKEPATTNAQDSRLRTSPAERKNLFMYPGQGAQYRAMGKALFDSNPVFRATFEHCNDLYEKACQRSLISEMYTPENPHAECRDVTLTHPALLSFCYSLTRTLVDAGVKVDGVVGYGTGEYIAAVVAGAMTLEEAMSTLVAQAATVSNLKPGGGMLSVLQETSHVSDHPSLYQQVELAAVNFPGNFVVSGQAPALQALQHQLDKQSIASLLLPVDHGFYCESMSSIEADFRQSLAAVDFKSASMPVFSATLAGEVEAHTAEHFWHVARNPVRFSELMDSLKTVGDYRFIDCSPTGRLSCFIRYGEIPVDHHTAVNPVGQNTNSVNTLVTELLG